MNNAISRKQFEAKAILREYLAEDTREEDIRSLFGQYECVSSLWVIPGVSNRRGGDHGCFHMRGRLAKATISVPNERHSGGLSCD
jgi:hypothetical protein